MDEVSAVNVVRIARLLVLTGGVTVAPALAEPPAPPAEPPVAEQPEAGNSSVAEPKAEPKGLGDTICPTIGREASLNDLPVEFFTRLIWQESRFDPNARSHKGAEGIAQFMPATARWRRLVNSYEPLEALRESARWLSELRLQFGNLGLAAAAYNAGPGRVRNWLNGQSKLPAETRRFVQIVTGRPAEEWRAARADEVAPTGNSIPCAQIAKRFTLPAAREHGTTMAGDFEEAAWAPWGLQLVGSWSESSVLADYRKLQARFPSILGDRKPLMLRTRAAGRGMAIWYRVRVAEQTREGASKLCAKLAAAGGACIVQRN
jgi:hypothetical protein